MRHLHRMVLLLCLAGIGSCAAVAAGRPCDVELVRGLTYATPGDTSLLLDLYRPMGAAAPVPVVLLIHGGSWVSGNRGQMRPYAELLATQGFAVAVPDYRLAPEHTYPAQLEDVRAAARWVQANAGRYGFDMRRFAAMGVSAGGQLAALLGVAPVEGTPQAACVIDIAGPMDFTAPAPSLQAKAAVQLYLGVDRDERPEVYAQASPISHITPGDPPFLIVHGTADQVVPFSQSTRMVTALQAANVPVTFLPLEDVGHTLLPPNAGQGREVAAAILSFLEHCGMTAPATPAAG